MFKELSTYSGINMRKNGGSSWLTWKVISAKIQNRKIRKIKRIGEKRKTKNLSWSWPNIQY